MDFEFFIAELQKVIWHYELPNVDFTGSEYKSQKEAVDEMNSIIIGLRNGDNNTLDRLSFLFATTSCVQEIAKRNGWADEFMSISRQVDLFINITRHMQKTNTALFPKSDGQYTDNNTYASCPGRLEISNEKWKAIKKIYKLNLSQRMKLILARGEYKNIYVSEIPNPLL